MKEKNTVIFLELEKGFNSLFSGNSLKHTEIETIKDILDKAVEAGLINSSEFSASKKMTSFLNNLIKDGRWSEKTKKNCLTKIKQILTISALNSPELSVRDTQREKQYFNWILGMLLFANNNQRDGISILINTDPAIHQALPNTSFWSELATVNTQYLFLDLLDSVLRYKGESTDKIVKNDRRVIRNNLLVLFRETAAKQPIVISDLIDVLMPEINALSQSDLSRGEKLGITFNKLRLIHAPISRLSKELLTIIKSSGLLLPSTITSTNARFIQNEVKVSKNKSTKLFEYLSQAIRQTPCKIDKRFAELIMLISDLENLPLEEMRRYQLSFNHKSVNQTTQIARSIEKLEQWFDDLAEQGVDLTAYVNRDFFQKSLRQLFDSPNLLNGQSFINFRKLFNAVEERKTTNHKETLDLNKLLARMILACYLIGQKFHFDGLRILTNAYQEALVTSRSFSFSPDLQDIIRLTKNTGISWNEIQNEFTSVLSQEYPGYQENGLQFRLTQLLKLIDIRGSSDREKFRALIGLSDHTQGYLSRRHPDDESLTFLELILKHSHSLPGQNTLISALMKIYSKHFGLRFQLLLENLSITIPEYLPVLKETAFENCKSYSSEVALDTQSEPSLTSDLFEKLVAMKNSRTITDGAIASIEQSLNRLVRKGFDFYKYVKEHDTIRRRIALCSKSNNIVINEMILDFKIMNLLNLKRSAHYSDPKIQYAASQQRLSKSYAHHCLFWELYRYGFYPQAAKQFCKFKSAYAEFEDKHSPVIYTQAEFNHRYEIPDLKAIDAPIHVLVDSSWNAIKEKVYDTIIKHREYTVGSQKNTHRYARYSLLLNEFSNIDNAPLSNSQKIQLLLTTFLKLAIDFSNEHRTQEQTILSTLGSIQLSKFTKAILRIIAEELRCGSDIIHGLEHEWDTTVVQDVKKYLDRKFEQKIKSDSIESNPVCKQLMKFARFSIDVGSTVSDSRNPPLNAIITLTRESHQLKGPSNIQESSHSSSVNEALTKVYNSIELTANEKPQLKTHRKAIRQLESWCQYLESVGFNFRLYFTKNISDEFAINLLQHKNLNKLIDMTQSSLIPITNDRNMHVDSHKMDDANHHQNSDYRHLCLGLYLLEKGFEKDARLHLKQVNPALLGSRVENQLKDTLQILETETKPTPMGSRLLELKHKLILSNHEMDIFLRKPPRRTDSQFIKDLRRVFLQQRKLRINYEGIINKIDEHQLQAKTISLPILNDAIKSFMTNLESLALVKGKQSTPIIANNTERLLISPSFLKHGQYCLAMSFLTSDPAYINDILNSLPQEEQDYYPSHLLFNSLAKCGQWLMRSEMLLQATLAQLFNEICSRFKLQDHGSLNIENVKSYIALSNNSEADPKKVVYGFIENVIHVVFPNSKETDPEMALLNNFQTLFNLHQDYRTGCKSASFKTNPSKSFGENFAEALRLINGEKSYDLNASNLYTKTPEKKENPSTQSENIIEPRKLEFPSQVAMTQSYKSIVEALTPPSSPTKTTPSITDDPDGDAEQEIGSTDSSGDRGKDFKSLETEDDSSVITQNNWYSDTTVNSLLRHYVELRNTNCQNQNVGLLTSMLGTNLPRGNDLIENLLGYQDQRDQRKPLGQTLENQIIIPVNLNRNHWTLLYIIYSNDENQPPSVEYFDPLGQGIPKDIQIGLRNIFPNVTIRESDKRIQTDGYNCGPWIIEAANAYLNGLPLTTLNSDMSQVRLEHTAILLVQDLTQTTQHHIRSGMR